MLLTEAVRVIGLEVDFVEMGAPRARKDEGEDGAVLKRKAGLPRGRTGLAFWVDLRGPYYNTNAQVRNLERLVKRLPKPSSTPDPADPLRKRRRTAKQLNAAETEQLVAGYQAGAKLRELGTQFGIHSETVGQILRREGVAMRPKSLTPEQVAEATRLYEAGWSSARIGERLGFNGTTIVATLRRRGTQIRDQQGR